MSEHLIIYLDESGDLGFDFNKEKTSHYFVIALLVCMDKNANKTTIQSVKKTLRNKLPKNTVELKGSNLILSIKKYFLRDMRKANNWYLCIAIADKKTWVKHHHCSNPHMLKTKMVYDELAQRIFSQLDCLDTAKNIDIIVDRSKTKGDILEFNTAVTNAIKKRLPKDNRLSIKHTHSHNEAGLQATDLFSSGVWRKYEKNDLTWYMEFSDKIATEIIHKF